MEKVLREALSEAEFAQIKTCKNIVDQSDPFIKIGFLAGQSEELTAKDEGLIRTWFNFRGLRPKEFFSLGEQRALELVNEMLSEQGMFPMELEDAIEILEADETFRKEIEDYLNRKVSERADGILMEKVKALIGEKAFCKSDYEIEYAEYRRRMDTLKEYEGYYYRIQKD